MTDAQPSYFYSMPTQLSVLFIIVTLLVILLIQLLFTVRYHIPLSKLNYALQVSWSFRLISEKDALTLRSDSDNSRRSNSVKYFSERKHPHTTTNQGFECATLHIQVQ